MPPLRRGTSTRPTTNKIDRALNQMAVGLTTEQSVRIFFGVLCQYPIILTDKVPIAGIDARNQIYCNPEALDTFTMAEVRGTLVHEVWHGILEHHVRMRHRDPTVWNYACDAKINTMLEDMGYVLPDGVIHDCRGRTHTEEELYEELVANPETQSPPPSGRGTEMGSDLQNTPNESGDNVPSPAEMQAAAEAMRQTFIRAVQQEQRMVGTVAGPLSQLYEKWTTPPPVPWHHLLADHLTKLSQREPSWTRPNKRLRRVAYLPSQRGRPSLGHVTMVLDVSGSNASAEQLAEARGQILSLLQQCPPKRLDILTADTRLVELQTDVDLNDPLPPTPVTCGGTDLEAALHEVEDEHIPDVCILLTDGCTPFRPDTRPWPDTTMIWIMSTAKVAPYGTTFTLPQLQGD